MANNKIETSITDTTLSDRIDEFVESLQMGKYGVVRIDWVINDDIKGLEGVGRSWSNEKNWENPAHTKYKITNGALKVFMEMGASPISFLAEYCKENKLDDEFFFFPQKANNVVRSIFDNTSVENINDFQLPKLEQDGFFTCKETDAIVAEELEHISPCNCEDDKDYLNKFKQYQEAYVEILRITSQKVFSNNPMYSIGSVVVTPIVTQSITNNYTEILGAYMIITSTFNAITLQKNDEFMQKLLSLKYACKSQVDEKISQRFFEKLKKESIKTAVSAIMSRNMSHNLGSHFISNTKNYFSTLIDFESSHKPIYRGVKYALQYIQERMDFIAAVTSDDINPFGSVNAKAQILDELTPDDIGIRHKGNESLNFLMDYLVLSERISKNSCDNAHEPSILSKAQSTLKLLMGYETTNNEVFFWDPSKKDMDNNFRRDSLETINFAIPGGILGRHALFSIIENVIRNAAKHRQNILQKEFVIKLLCTNDNHFVIFDSKEDDKIHELVIELRERLNGVEMINENGTLNQDNKGLKEILICAIWLQNKNFAKTIFEKQMCNNEGRYDEFVQILAVDKDGHELKDGNTRGFLAYKIHLNRFNKCIVLDSLAVDGIIPYGGLKKISADIVCATKDYSVCCANGTKTLSQIFPRFVAISESEYEDYTKKNAEDGLGFDDNKSVELLKSVVARNCKIDMNRTAMVLSSDCKDKFQVNDSCPVLFVDNYSEKSNDDFLFKIHAGKSKKAKFETLFLTDGFENKYIDSISGGDFTHTMVQQSFVEDPYNLYKIYESVHTRFVIIDERIFEQHRSPLTTQKKEKMIRGVEFSKQKANQGEMTEDDLIQEIFVTWMKIYGSLDEMDSTTKEKLVRFIKDDERFEQFLAKDIEQHYLERKNIHLFSFEKAGDDFELKDLSNHRYGHFIRISGSEVKYNDNESKQSYFEEVESDSPITFLSIHLGLIDKIKDGLGMVNNPNFDESIIVEELKGYFGAKFVSIHSGRGGFDVREKLKKYAFQSYSSVENPFHNSKYLLAQQFYNLNFNGTE